MGSKICDELPKDIVQSVYPLVVLDKLYLNHTKINKKRERKRISSHFKVGLTVVAFGIALLASVGWPLTLVDRDDDVFAFDCCTLLDVTLLLLLLLLLVLLLLLLLLFDCDCASVDVTVVLETWREPDDRLPPLEEPTLINLRV